MTAAEFVTLEVQKPNADHFCTGLRELVAPAKSIRYTAAEPAAAGGTPVYAPEPHNPCRCNVAFRDLAESTGRALRQARHAIREQLNRSSLGRSP